MFQKTASLLSMQTKLLQLDNRLIELESLGDEVAILVQKYISGKDVQPDLNAKGQRWYRGAREVLVQQEYSGLAEFDQSWMTGIKDIIEGGYLINPDNAREWFPSEFRKARALLGAVAEEIRSRELPVKAQLSFAISAEEFEKALELLTASGSDEVIIRASGVVGRVALERHLWTVIETHGITVQKNPPNKKKPDTQDLLTTLIKENVLTQIQKSELDGLFTIGNNCAHPKEAVVKADVERFLRRGRELAALIL